MLLDSLAQRHPLPPFWYPLQQQRIKARLILLFSLVVVLVLPLFSTQMMVVVMEKP
jgi:hypothetical protein